MTAIQLIVSVAGGGPSSSSHSSSRKVILVASADVITMENALPLLLVAVSMMTALSISSVKSTLTYSGRSESAPCEAANLSDCHVIPLRESRCSRPCMRLERNKVQNLFARRVSRGFGADMAQPLQPPHERALRPMGQGKEIRT